MRASGFTIAVLLILAGQVEAQPGTPAIPPAPIEEQPLPGGAPVSQPLQSVDPPATLPPALEPGPVVPPDPNPPIRPNLNPRDVQPNKVLGGWWDSDELLIWWPKATPLPPLITASRGSNPAFGAPGTVTLAGTQAIDTQDHAGYRLAFGWSLNNEDTIGFEGRYFFLGTRTFSASATDLGDSRYRTIGLSFLNANTGQEDSLVLARAGISNALVTASSSTRVQGAEANVVGNLYASGGVKIHALAGYRFLQANEGLRVESTWLQNPHRENGYHSTLGMIADQIDAHNEFHGGQIGLTMDAHRGQFYIEVTGKAALGTNFEMVRIDGATHLITANHPIPLLQSFHGGVYAQGTNIGRYTRSQFALVPEGTFKVGLKMGDRGRFYIGYNFLYMSDVVRPGDQIDRSLNPNQIPIVSRGLPFMGPDRPVPTLLRTDFWTQGLLIGFEARF